MGLSAFFAIRALLDELAAEEDGQTLILSFGPKVAHLVPSRFEGSVLSVYLTRLCFAGRFVLRGSNNVLVFLCHDLSL
jgi:hypothetical protein